MKFLKFYMNNFNDSSVRERGAKLQKSLEMKHWKII